MNYLIKLLSVICLFAFIYGKKITLLDYGLEPNTINCTPGYASINHTIVLTCLVNYSEDESIIHVQFRIQNVIDGSSTHLSDFNIASNCLPNVKSPDCVIVGKGAVKITVKVDASQENSGVNIYARLFGEDRTDSVQSNTIKLPEITEIGSECNITTDNGGTFENIDFTKLVYGMIPSILCVGGLVGLITFCWRKCRKHLRSSEEKKLQEAPTNGRDSNDVFEATINSYEGSYIRQPQNVDDSVDYETFLVRGETRILVPSSDDPNLYQNYLDEGFTFQFTERLVLEYLFVRSHTKI
ncbi:unnamed protein product [Lymnaea stagnalis]|uniref:Uncharacterized protein n=1 Tax=Lymnaea stagnalis TaxID=6523 RepID=A0AAV2HJ57_LYMST